MSLYPQARFDLSANKAGQFPSDTGREVAFAGRSNAGKSSAINAIVNRRQFARVSKTPGRTQLINFFTLQDSQRLVDLPGYGFAKVPESMRQHWGVLLQAYFTHRESLAGLILVVDVRRLLTDFDWQLLRLADAVAAPVHVLLTKSDKLKRGQATDALREAGKQLGATATAQLFSATRKVGLDEARERMQGFLAAATDSGQTDS
ncbi:MAG TPA: ribosome biogenesis GTP-binding protein YihA/YsxC [Woeseiaceae bacterium]